MQLCYIHMSTMPSHIRCFPARSRPLACSHIDDMCLLLKRFSTNSLDLNFANSAWIGRMHDDSIIKIVSAQIVCVRRSLSHHLSLSLTVLIRYKIASIWCRSNKAMVLMQMFVRSTTATKISVKMYKLCDLLLPHPHHSSLFPSAPFCKQSYSTSSHSLLTLAHACESSFRVYMDSSKWWW